jgi:tetratricopeptide (TPR) repeat protein
MRIRSGALGLSLALVLQCGAITFAQTDGARQFAQAKALLAQADFRGALDAFKAASKAEPENSEYFQEYALLRRVIRIREQLKEEEDAETWQKMSRALYNYYRQHKINGEALATARALYEKAASGESAALLADAQLAADDNAAAVALLSQLDEGARTIQTDVLHGIALARVSKLADARAMAGKLELPKDCDGPLCFDAARLYALVGDAEKAIGALTCAFERTPANQLEAVKADAKQCRDLAALTGSPAFASALEVKSKVAAGCAKDGSKCPSKDKGGRAENNEKEAAGCKEHEKRGEQ